MFLLYCCLCGVINDDDDDDDDDSNVSELLLAVTRRTSSQLTHAQAGCRSVIILPSRLTQRRRMPTDTR